MPKSHHDHQQDIVFDGVDDAVVADPDTKTWPALKSPCTRRSRILGEKGDCTLDATTNLSIELAQ